MCVYVWASMKLWVCPLVTFDVAMHLSVIVCVPGRSSRTIACTHGCEGSYLISDELAFVQLVRPTCLCEVIAVETNRYAQQNNHPKWVDVSTDEVLDIPGDCFDRNS